MKKILRRLLFLILTIISITVIYTYGYRAVFVFLSSRSVKLERSIDFSGTGQGITWMQEGAAKTLFFIPSSEESAVEDLYGSWLRELYTAQGVNIIVPPFDGLLNRPDLRGDSYDPRSRDRDVLFLFNLYSAMVGKKHEITVMSTGDGSLQALELARNGVSAEKYLLLSPVHGERINRGAGFFQKIASLPYFHYLMPRLPYGYGRNRAGSFDILNDDLNAAFAAGAAKSYPPFADYASLSNIDRQARESSRSMDKVKPSRFFIIYGDDDLSYSLEGFERMGDALKEGGSEVTIMRISSSGRMLLFDNGKDRILDLLSILLQ